MKEWQSQPRAELKKLDATIFFPLSAKMWGGTIGMEMHVSVSQ
jgi:hypothetical protein